MPAHARRIQLRPLQAYAQEDLEAGAFEATKALEGRLVRVGDAVEGEHATFVIAEADPTIPARATREAEVRIEVTPVPPPQHAVYDALFLLDASWSMGKDDHWPSRFALARHALANAVARGGDVVRFCTLGVFTREAVLLSPFDQLARLDVHRALEGVEPHGRTDLAEAVSGGVAELRAVADPKKHHAIVIASDETEPEEDFEEAVARAERLRVELHLLHFGAERTPRLETAAQRTGGSYQWAQDAPTLKTAFEAMARNVGLPLDWPDEAAPPEPGSEGELEVVMRSMTPDGPPANPETTREES